jgi:hypothetical protein
MPQVLATVLVIACCLAGTGLIVAALRQKWVIRLSPKQREMSRPIHLMAALLFLGMPMLMYCRWLSWPLPALYLALSGATVAYACVAEARARRRLRAG